MKAIRLFSPGDLRCVEMDKPQIERGDEVIVKVKACGVCGSDIMRVMKKGTYRYPITIGHEFSGEVESIGDGIKNLTSGDRVTVMPLIPCGQCNYCKIGQFILCDDYQYYGSRIDGAMAEYVRVSAANVLKLPGKIGYEPAAMTDPCAIALHAVRKADVEPGQKALILGMGTIGLIALQWLKTVGISEVYVVDVYDEKLQLALSLGADKVINGKKQNIVEVVKEKTAGSGVDLVIELAGSKITQVQAIQCVRKMGTVVYCGISYDDLIIPNSELSKILRGELVLKGAWNSTVAPLPINEWEISLRAMESGRIKTDQLVTHRFKLKEYRECFEMLYNRSQVFIKVMFIPEA